MLLLQLTDSGVGHIDRLSGIKKCVFPHVLVQLVNLSKVLIDYHVADLVNLQKK
jgi:hypothetical protein